MKWSDLVNREGWNEMVRTNRIPASGHLLAYLRKKVIFRPYGSIDGIGNLLGDGDLLEIHLFDDEKEYRAVKTRGSLQGEDRDYIECTVPGADDTGQECYKEEVLLEHHEGDVLPGHGHGSLVVWNYLKYSKEGMAYVNNYRLSMRR